MSVMLYPCMFCVALLMDLFDSVCELFGETIFVVCLGVFAILLLNVWSSKECVCCACDPSERLDAPAICVVCVFVCQKLSPHL